jgi:predicted enzyme related to lactoylglutathione lyase
MKHRRSFLVPLFWMLLLAGTYSAVSGRTPPPDVGAGRIAWFDISTTNLDEAKNFYGKLFGWTFEALKGTDKAVEIVADGTSIGTLRVANGKISDANGVVYVQVADITISCVLAKELGGKIVLGFPFNLSDGRGAIALLLDPSGHPVGMYSKAPLPAASPPAK